MNEPFHHRVETYTELKTPNLKRCLCITEIWEEDRATVVMLAYVRYCTQRHRTECLINSRKVLLIALGVGKLRITVMSAHSPAVMGPDLTLMS